MMYKINAEHPVDAHGAIYLSHNIGVNISEQKSGTERTKKRKKQELVIFSRRQGTQLLL